MSLKKKDGSRLIASNMLDINVSGQLPKFALKEHINIITHSTVFFILVHNSVCPYIHSERKMNGPGVI